MAVAVPSGCPYCDSQTVRPNGERKGRRMYICPRCGKQSRDRGAMGGRHSHPELIGAAISSFYAGSSLRQIVEGMKERNMEGTAPLSPDTVGRWVVDHTEYALRLTTDVKFGGSHLCNLFSVASPMRNERQWWALFARSVVSQYILACHVTTNWNEKVVADFVWSLPRVLDLTKDPTFFAVRTNSIYASALDRLSLSPYNFPEIGSLFHDESSPQSEVEEYIMRQVKRAFRMKSPERAELHLRGWALSYNQLNSEHLERLNTRLENLNEPKYHTVQIPTWADVVRIRARNE